MTFESIMRWFSCKYIFSFFVWSNPECGYFFFRKFGPQVQKDNTIIWTEWAPAAEKLTLTGSFNNWDRCEVRHCWSLNFTAEVSPLVLAMSICKLYIIFSSFWRKSKSLTLVIWKGQVFGYGWVDWLFLLPFQADLAFHGGFLFQNGNVAESTFLPHAFMLLHMNFWMSSCFGDFCHDFSEF